MWMAACVGDDLRQALHTLSPAALRSETEIVEEVDEVDIVCRSTESFVVVCCSRYFRQIGTRFLFEGR